LTLNFLFILVPSNSHFVSSLYILVSSTPIEDFSNTSIKSVYHPNGQIVLASAIARRHQHLCWFHVVEKWC
jgi:hypothetical protein